MEAADLLQALDGNVHVMINMHDDEPKQKAQQKATGKADMAQMTHMQSTPTTAPAATVRGPQPNIAAVAGNPI